MVHSTFRAAQGLDAMPRYCLALVSIPHASCGLPVRHGVVSGRLAVIEAFPSLFRHLLAVVSGNVIVKHLDMRADLVVMGDVFAESIDL